MLRFRAVLGVMDIQLALPFTLSRVDLQNGEIRVDGPTQRQDMDVTDTRV